MKFITEKKNILIPLQKINTLLIKNNPNKILGNILIEINKKNIFLRSTNTEIELIYKISNDYECNPGKITVSGRKMLEIFRIISEKSLIYIKLIKKKLYISSNKSKFCLLTISEKKFPYFKKKKYKRKFHIEQKIFKNMLEYIYFSMSSQDIRPYLNGIFIEFQKKYIRSIATNGHRMAIFKKKIKERYPIFSMILPRKSVIELIKLLNHKKNLITILYHKNYIQFHIENIIFTSKLINSNFPNLDHILIKDKKYTIKTNAKKLKKSLSHVSILVHEQLKGIYLKLSNNQCKITSHNQDEQAKYKFTLKYKYHKKIKLSLNINYLLDVLNVLKNNFINLILDEKIQYLQIEVPDKPELKYIILPLYL
ncbi:DNA polymerase III subunit beta [Buchnera aphidicola]|uniref:DNA polymerase III subunit beta n=1 Tax=Buchnera aphidicola TaxID=9 RepID=UPI002092FC52|nr:DNA polymerase III subunit beta [Buchnera aphidicola]USS94145.1 DNA polymerase III subunit beta [Buchnera aphidicola (Sipha maydis)]WII23693.1 DNA polymerase III subunit beta [Buchnera aphidicola (Sipha maydis)]